MRENYEYYFTVPRTFVQDYRNLRYARISMLWSNDSSQNRVSTDHYHSTVWLAPSLTNGADAVSFVTFADHQLSVFTRSQALIYPRKEI